MQNNKLATTDQIAIYTDGELELNISIDEENIWLTQRQIAELFGVTKQNISLHTIEIYKTKELDKNATVKKYLTVQKEGNREVARELEHYNLDMVISVGYRVNSIKATRFRKWATAVLREYITSGYAINYEKITHDRFASLEKSIDILRAKVEKIDNLIDSGIKPKQGIFYNGQIFDAYAFVNDLLQDAKKSVVLIDNYIDQSIFVLFSKYPLIKFEIYTQTIGDQLRLDYEKYQKQYKNITLKTTKNFHDRFLIVDDQLYHIGASLKDLGNKIFAFSKLNVDVKEFLAKL